MLTSGEIEAVRLVGPTAPATKRGFVRRLRRVLVGGRARELCGGQVHLVGQLLHAVVGQGDALRVEGVGLDDVGAGLQVLLVDLLDDRRLRQHQQVVVALDVTLPIREALAAITGLLAAYGAGSSCPWRRR